MGGPEIENRVVYRGVEGCGMSSSRSELWGVGVGWAEGKSEVKLRVAVMGRWNSWKDS